MPIIELKLLEKIMQPARKWPRNYEVQDDILQNVHADVKIMGKRIIGVVLVHHHSTPRRDMDKLSPEHIAINVHMGRERFKNIVNT